MQVTLAELEAHTNLQRGQNTTAHRWKGHSAHKGPNNVLGGTYITLLPGLLLLPVLLAKY